MSDWGRTVFCTTCRNRTPHLRVTLPKNLADNPENKFVLVNYNTEDDMMRFLADECARDIESGRLVVYSYLEPTKYKFSHAKNLAHRLGVLEGGEILVSLDADNFAGPNFGAFAEREIDYLEDAFLWARMRKGKTPRGINGRIAVTNRTFLKLGGYDEAKFQEWGSEDKDFHLRLEMAGHTGVEIPPSYLQAITHNDRVRFRDYPHVAAAAYTDDYHRVDRSTIGKLVVNDGAIGCGRVVKNFDPSNVLELGPVPTRIFGIGLHKTGTTSLHQALKRLGFDSWHWTSAHAAKAMWQEMTQAGRSPTLERWHALCDLPIPLLYKELDRAYPGSKFVLTVRGEDEWLKSVEKHFSPVFNRFRNGWDSDPFSNQIHHKLYHRTSFDAAVMINRYRRHNGEVWEYFQDRPNDLLIMDMRRSDGWEKLCRFLDRPVPAQPYPRENSSSGR